MIYMGERLQSGSGVLRSCNVARKKQSWSRLLVGDSRRRLAVFVATSARPFD